jgi:AAA ATPase domain
VAGESERYLCHMLVGRGPECARIDELLADARQGRAGTLVLRGEAGIGKGALLACSEERAGGMTVLHARGIESEAELAFSEGNVVSEARARAALAELQ